MEPECEVDGAYGRFCDLTSHALSALSRAPPLDSRRTYGTSLPRSLRALRMRASNRVSVPLMGACRTNPSDVNSSTMAKGPTGEIEDKPAVNVPR